MMDFARARGNMVENQIRAIRVTDPLVIAAMAELPREAFVPEAVANIAYSDESLAVGVGRYLMEPMVLARMLQHAGVSRDDVAMVVGCASGYSAAVMAKIAGTVVAVEDEPELIQRATQVLSDLGIDNAAVIEAPLTGGYPKQAPYDVILLGGAVAQVPDAITGQLADRGRLVAIMVDGAGMSRARLITRIGDTLSGRDLFDAGTPLLPGFDRRPEFEF